LSDKYFSSFWRQKATPELKKSRPQKNLALTFFLGTCLHEWKSRRKRAKKVHTLLGVVQKKQCHGGFSTREMASQTGEKVDDSRWFAFFS
jgi:hypothetical protein